MPALGLRPAGAMGMLGPCLLVERPGIVAAAQRSPRRRHRELFVVDCLEADGTWAHGELDGVRSTRTVTVPKPGRHDAEETGQSDDLAEARRADGRWETSCSRPRRWASPAGPAHPSVRSPSADPAADRRVTVDGGSFET
ncbi:hypothetical protein [Streptomyces chrestomyceticus]|uniref:hypothetical protein n=1 Tax=Streptomyces chrestomyceticus TaxID=68185 RepID=UPI00379B2E8C